MHRNSNQMGVTYTTQIDKTRSGTQTKRSATGRASWRRRICSGSHPVISTIFRRRPGPPNMEGAFSASEMTYIVSSGALNSTHSLARRYAGSVCISLTRKRTSVFAVLSCSRLERIHLATYFDAVLKLQRCRRTTEPIDLGVIPI